MNLHPPTHHIYHTLFPETQLDEIQHSIQTLGNCTLLRILPLPVDKNKTLNGQKFSLQVPKMTAD